MSLLDIFTGNKDNEASDALRRAEDYYGSIQAPTAQELTLPELQKYVEAGIMTPAEAQSYLQSSNAYENMNIPQGGTGAQVSALNQLGQIANAGAGGTPLEQAQMENSLEKMRTADQGEVGALEQSMAARGTPRALIEAALAPQIMGQNSQQAHMDAVNSNAAMYQNALNALSQQGSVGNSLQGQQNNQANTVAGAANAMQQFNAQNQQNTSQFNAANKQASNAMNAANKQQVSNNNTGIANARTQYNTQVPQQVFNNSMNKAAGMAGAATNYGNLQQQQGQQNAGITAGLIDLGSSFIPKPTSAAPGTAMAHGGIVDHDHSICMAHGGYCMAEGGQVPGDSNFPGDTEANDTVPIMASPGEAVIPRSSVQQNPQAVDSLINGNSDDMGDTGEVQDVATLLKAMRAIRMGVA